jgi:hypothetical protein
LSFLALGERGRTWVLSDIGNLIVNSPSAVRWLSWRRARNVRPQQQIAHSSRHRVILAALSH